MLFSEVFRNVNAAGDRLAGTADDNQVFHCVSFLGRTHKKRFDTENTRRYNKFTLSVFSWWLLLCGLFGRRVARKEFLFFQVLFHKVYPFFKGRTQVTTPGGIQETWIINESGLYNVILRSDKPEAKPFRKWVTGKVLPSIRKISQDQITFSIVEIRYSNFIGIDEL